MIKNFEDHANVLRQFLLLRQALFCMIRDGMNKIDISIPVILCHYYGGETLWTWKNFINGKILK